MPRLCSCVLAGLLLSAAGCIKVQQHSTTDTRVPAVLQGHWNGAWSSAASATQGALELRVQSFADHPVLRVVTDNPCLTPAHYEFLNLGLRFEMRRDGVTVFAATLDPDARTLAGDYECDDDHGTWSAHWDRDLPPIGDVTGTWTGTISAGTPPRTVNLGLDLEQVWVDGFLTVTGSVNIPEMGFSQGLTGGLVEWHDDDFDIALRSDGTVGIALLLQGVGQSANRSVENGLVVAQDPRLPFSTGVWTAAWSGN